MEPITLRPSKTKGLLLLCGSLIFVAGGVGMIKSGEMFGWASVIFFGLCALVFSIKMLPNASYLKLHHEGFTQVTMFRSSTFRWQDVSEFSVDRIGGNKTVMLDFVLSWHTSSKLKKVARLMSGHDGALPDTYGLRAEELVALLKEWKNKSQN
jgi:hypothetical protein